MAYSLFMSPVLSNSQYLKKQQISVELNQNDCKINGVVSNETEQCKKANENDNSQDPLNVVRTILKKSFFNLTHIHRV